MGSLQNKRRLCNTSRLPNDPADPMVLEWVPGRDSVWGLWQLLQVNHSGLRILKQILAFLLENYLRFEKKFLATEP